MTSCATPVYYMVLRILDIEKRICITCEAGTVIAQMFYICNNNMYMI